MSAYKIASGLILVTMLACAGCATGGLTGNLAHVEAGFETIFDGTSLDGWEFIVEQGHPLKEDAFYLEDGTLACKGYGWHWFRYTEPLADVVVRMEFKIAKDSNSGVCLRSKKEGAPPPFTGFEVQIVDDVGAEPNKHGTGAIYDILAPTQNPLGPIGEWNEMEITCNGLLVTVVINGVKVIDTDFSELTEPIGKFNFAYADMPRTGYLAFQDHWTAIWYRNIRIKRL